MQVVYSTIGVALVVALTFIVIVILFRDPIRKRIAGGSKVVTEISAKGARLVLGENETAFPAAGGQQAGGTGSAAGKDRQPGDQPEAASHPSDLPADPNLSHLVPPLDPYRFRVVLFPFQEHPPFYNFPYAPSGLAVFNGVPFYLRPVVDEADRMLGHQVWSIQPQPDNSPAMLELAADAERVSVLHCLISAEHGWRFQENVQFLHKKIGYLELVFADDSLQKVDLVLGRHLREWAFGNSTFLVQELDFNLARPAWVSHNGYCRIDHLSIPILDPPRALKRIRLVGKFEDGPVSHLQYKPGIQLSAITCERSLGA